MKLLAIALTAMTALCHPMASAQTHHPVVADSASKIPLPAATIFDHAGNFVGVTNNHGVTPYLGEEKLPFTVRYIGYKERQFTDLDADTIFMAESPLSLDEVIVESKQHKVMHILAYVREYSTLTNYDDTVFLFREKMVDFMINPDKKVKFKGWNNPRVLNSVSYYRFTNSLGLDSVSDESNYHFSWSDWVGLGTTISLPEKLVGVKQGTDTLRGKYSPTEIWMKNSDHVTLNVNVLADTASRKWVPNLSPFFRKNIDFERFRVKYNYTNVIGTNMTPMDITSYSCNIESNDRGHKMFMFNGVNSNIFVSTYAETYMLDKEYITLSEARKWEKLNLTQNKIKIFEPDDAPQLQASVQQLIDRVNNVDNEGVRLGVKQDMTLVRRNVVKDHIGKRLLSLLKTMTGISSIRAKRNEKKSWNKFRKTQMNKNNARMKTEDK